MLTPDPRGVGTAYAHQGTCHSPLKVLRTGGSASADPLVWTGISGIASSIDCQARKERQKTFYHKHTDASSLTVLVISLVLKSWAISLAWPFISIGFVFGDIWILFTKRHRGLVDGRQWAQLFPPLVQMEAAYPSSSENFAGVLITNPSFFAHIFTCFC